MCLGRKNTEEQFHFCHMCPRVHAIEDACHPYNLLLLILTSVTWLRTCMTSFLAESYSFPHSLSTLCPVGRSHWGQTILHHKETGSLENKRIPSDEQGKDTMSLGDLVVPETKEELEKKKKNPKDGVMSRGCRSPPERLPNGQTERISATK